MKKSTLIIHMLVFCAVTNLFSQTTLSEGDIAFIALNSDRDVDLSFVQLKDIGSGTTINFTDYGWNDGTSGAFFTDSSLSAGDYSGLVWTATSSLSAGQVIHIQTTSGGTIAPENIKASVGSVYGSILLSYTGDQLFAYQGSESSPQFIAALHWNVEAASSSNNWDGSAYSNKTSALPDQLTNGVNAIWLYAPGPTEKDNFIYNCSVTSGTAEELRTSINNIANWSVDISNTTAYTQNPFPCTFNVVDPCTSPTIPQLTAGSKSICYGSSTSISIHGTLSDATSWHIYTA